MNDDQILRTLVELERVRRTHDILPTYIARALAVPVSDIVNYGVRPFTGLRYCKRHPQFLSAYRQALILAQYAPQARHEYAFVTGSDFVNNVNRLERIRKEQGRSPMEIVDLLSGQKVHLTLGSFQSIVKKPEDHVVTYTQHKPGFIEAYYRVLGFGEIPPWN